MNDIYLLVVKRFVAWDSTVRLPQALAVGYDPNWDRFYAKVFLDGDLNRPHIWIGMLGHDGAETVEDLAGALQTYTHVPEWARTELRFARDSTNAELRTDARVRRESVGVDGNPSLPRTHFLHPVEGYLPWSEVAYVTRLAHIPVGPIVLTQPGACDTCGCRLSVGESGFLYVDSDAFMCGHCAFPGLSTNGSLRARKNHNADLHESTLSGCLRGVCRAIHAGADVNVQDTVGRSALYHACANSHDSIALELLAAGARPDGGNALYAPLAAASRNGNMKLTTWLVKLGAPVDAADREITPLLCAAELGLLELVRMLLRAGASPNRISRNGRTALLGAIEVGSKNRPDTVFSIVNELVRAGARLDISDEAGNTPLHWAAAAGDPALVDLLLLSGAKPTHCNATGDTPITVAMRMGRERIADRLRGCAPTWSQCALF